jgi:uncharacterized membrane protein YuzA (DUF378 family)
MAVCLWLNEVVMEPLGAMLFNPNSVFIIVGFVGLFYWLNLQKKYNQKADKEGGMK